MKKRFFSVSFTGGLRSGLSRSGKMGVTLFFAAALFFNSCFARAQDPASPDMAKALKDAGLPLLKQKVASNDFSLPLVVPGSAGKTQTLSELKGKVVFLNFWASWCPPCRSEMPSMEALYDRYREKGLEILAVNSWENQAQILAFMKNNNLTFPVALDSDKKVSTIYGIQAIPASYIIDRDGMIIIRLVGNINWDSPKIRSAMELLLK